MCRHSSYISDKYTGKHLIEAAIVFSNQLIARTVEISGTGEITIDYDGRNRAPATRSFLVE